jgi:hypothetical protein
LADAYLLRGRSGDDAASLQQLEILIEKMEDERIVSLPKNQATWYEHLEESPEDAPILAYYDMPMVKLLAYQQAAFTAYMVGQKADAESYAQKAKNIHLESEDETTVKNILESNIERLESEREDLHTSIAEYKRSDL